jgi:hypothetical protein
MLSWCVNGVLASGCNAILGKLLTIVYYCLVVAGWWGGNVYLGIPLVAICIICQILGSYYSYMCHLIVFHSDLLCICGIFLLYPLFVPF